MLSIRLTSVFNQFRFLLNFIDFNFLMNIINNINLIMDDKKYDEETSKIKQKESAIAELKRKIERLEKMSEKNKIELIKDTKTTNYLSNTRFSQYKLYHYFLFLKIFTNHMHDKDFISSRRAMLVAIGFPIIVAGGFAFANPISVFKKSCMNLSNYRQCWQLYIS